jgi:flagellar biogenesis protein FliO
LAIFFTSDFVFRYQLEYNEMGRHFDEEDAVVYHEQAVLFYGFFSLISFIALILIGRWTIKTIGTKVV